MEAEDKYPGTVQLPLAEYHRLLDSCVKAIDMRIRLKKISEQLEKFLSFIATEEIVRKAITEFNSQSSVCQIHLVDGRIQIEIK